MEMPECWKALDERLFCKPIYNSDMTEVSSIEVEKSDLRFTLELMREMAEALEIACGSIKGEWGFIDPKIEAPLKKFREWK